MGAVGDQIFLRQTRLEPLPPPSARAGAFGWMRANLFSSPANIVLTALCVALIVWAVSPLVRFFLIDAVWTGADGSACLTSPAQPNPGACWAFIRVWFSYFVYGFYPLDERWRVDVFFVALVFGFVWLLRLSMPRRDLGALYFFVVLPMNALIARMHHEPPPDPSTRNCPECLSEIPIAARRCKFCTAPVVV